MTTTLEQLSEITTLGTPNVDRACGVVRGVKLIGTQSKNKRSYPEQTLRNAARLYENTRVNIDHGPRDQNADRSYRDRFGTIRNVRFRNGGLYGDLHYNPRHPVAEQFLWDAENNPSNLGLSHVAEGKTTRASGQTVVEEIVSVRSVDIVSDPATVAGLFESAGGGRSTVRDEYPADGVAFARTLTADTFTPRNPFRLREAEDAQAGEIIGDEVGDMAIAEKRIGDVIKQIAERRDISAAQRAKAIERLGALLDKIRSNYMDIDAEIAAVLKELPDKAEAAAMERAGQSSESLTRYLTGEARGGVGLRESASEGKARSFARSIT